MTVESVESTIGEVFARADARGFLHVREIGGAASVDIDADAPVAVASVIKVVLCLAFAREVAAGRIDAAERAEVPAALRVGGIGTAGCRDPVQMSLYDLARFMMTMSDNAATDVVAARTGRAAIDAVLGDLGLVDTHVRGDMMWGHMGVVRALGLPTPYDLDAQVDRADPAAVWRLAWIDPGRANASTPREIGRLLEAIWTDAAGPATACAFVRDAMAAQLTEHRLAAGFPEPDVTVAGKTGTLPAIRNEAGVIAFPDGRRYLACVFTRATSLAPRLPAVDAATGTAARLAVDHLRAG